MKNIVALLLLTFSPIFAENVESISENVILSMQQMSNSFKKVKDKQSALDQGKEVKKIADQLSQYAEALKKLPVPTNAERIKLKAKLSKKIEAISLEMAKTLAILMNNASAISTFSIELNKVQAQLEANQIIFDRYFEPNSPAKGKQAN